ncbi:MAG: DUF559 domain-containing protein [Rhizomicrobium sp.]
MKRGRTEAEIRLWAALKQLNQLGYHFRRDAIFQTFHLDFVEHDILLVIELAEGRPGEHFDGDVRPSPDIAREHVLLAAGYTILRFWKADLAQDLGEALFRLRQILEDRPPLQPADVVSQK